MSFDVSFEPSFDVSNDVLRAQRCVFSPIPPQKGQIMLKRFTPYPTSRYVEYKAYADNVNRAIILLRAEPADASLILSNVRTALTYLKLSDTMLFSIPGWQFIHHAVSLIRDAEQYEEAAVVLDLWVQIGDAVRFAPNIGKKGLP